MREIDTENINPSTAVVEAIQEQTGMDVSDFCLYDNISPDALDELLGPDSSSVSGVRITFSVDGYIVVVKQEKESTIVEVESEGRGWVHYSGP